jgi:GlcNAc-P-P-Und epimerase
MKIIFTGANGFLGKNIIPILNLKNFKVYSLGTSNADYTFDLSKQVPVFNENFDVVFHAAGKAHSTPKTIKEEQQFYDVNFEGTKNFCKGLEQIEQLPKHFIFISSVAVYGLEEGDKISENNPLNGRTPYAKSKIMAENFLLDWCQMNKIKLSILRPSLIVGPNPPGNLGDIIKAINKGRYFNIAGGKAKKSMVWVEDFADIIELLLKRDGGIYNVCSTQEISFKEISNKICFLLNKNQPFSMPFLIAKLMALVGDFFGDKSPFNSVKLYKILNSLTFSNKKISEELGWNATNPLEKLRI